MALEDIIKEFKESACGEIELASEGLNRYLVSVPFSFTDGDHYVVVLRREGDKWVLSDEGHTFMHLSYELRDWNSRRGTEGGLSTRCWVRTEYKTGRVSWY